ncbi:hypothetical protein Aduo_010233 [Ancylostoma duodenale]
MGEGARVRLVDEFSAKKGGASTRSVTESRSRMRQESQGSDTATMNFVTDDRVAGTCTDKIVFALLNLSSRAVVQYAVLQTS